jgi:5'(3')-deoxyribonucleotidase
MVKTALFDMDETLCDTWGQTIKDLSPYFSKEILVGINLYDESLPLEIRNKIKEIRNRAGWWRTLPTIESGMQLWQYMRGLGFETALASKGPYLQPHAWGEKFQWQKEILPEADEILISSKNKNRVDGDVLVDDWPKYVLGFLENHKKSVAIIPERPYNLDFQHPRAIHYDGKNFKQIEQFLGEHKLL